MKKLVRLALNHLGITIYIGLFLFIAVLIFRERLVSVFNTITQSFNSFIDGAFHLAYIFIGACIVAILVDALIKFLFGKKD